MKGAFFVIILLGLASCKLNDSSRSKIIDYSDEVFEMISIGPSFPGGEDSMLAFLAGNINYPMSDLSPGGGVQGVVFVCFLVDTNGVISNVRVEKPLHPTLDEEVVRVVKLMPNWIPVTIRGERIEKTWCLPVQFGDGD